MTKINESLHHREGVLKESNVIDLGNGRWIDIGCAANGQQIVSLFTQCPWILHDVAARGLRYVNLRERLGSSLSLGIYRDALVVTLRLEHRDSGQQAIEAAVAELMRFSDLCMQS